MKLEGKLIQRGHRGSGNRKWVVEFNIQIQMIINALKPLKTDLKIAFRIQ